MEDVNRPVTIRGALVRPNRVNLASVAQRVSLCKCVIL